MIFLKSIVFLTQAKFGGANSTVEMDETHLFTRKYDNSRVLFSQGFWIIGANERRSKYIKLRMVKSAIMPQSNDSQIIILSLVLWYILTTGVVITEFHFEGIGTKPSTIA
ncbi:hypothetical protein ENBRE01_3072 [Enteropsectra breve]|nr:hypothetical protein ENBRE01_3072 [Enteropsectra breve]